MASKKKVTSSKIKAVNTKRGVKMGAIRSAGTKSRAAGGLPAVGGKGGGD